MPPKQEHLVELWVLGCWDLVTKRLSSLGVFDNAQNTTRCCYCSSNVHRDNCEFVTDSKELGCGAGKWAPYDAQLLLREGRGQEINKRVVVNEQGFFIDQQVSTWKE